MEENAPIISNDAVVFGLLMATLAIVFATSASKRPFWVKFYTYVPTVLLCYFIPAVFNSLGLISGESSNLYRVASRYLLPASLVLFTISIDLKGILKLVPKALTMFLTGTIGITSAGSNAKSCVRSGSGKARQRCSTASPGSMTVSSCPEHDIEECESGFG